MSIDLLNLNMGNCFGSSRQHHDCHDGYRNSYGSPYPHPMMPPQQPYGYPQKQMDPYMGSNNGGIMPNNYGGYPSQPYYRGGYPSHHRRHSYDSDDGYRGSRGGFQPGFGTYIAAGVAGGIAAGVAGEISEEIMDDIFD